MEMQTYSLRKCNLFIEKKCGCMEEVEHWKVKDNRAELLVMSNRGWNNSSREGEDRANQPRVNLWHRLGSPDIASSKSLV